MYSPTAMQHFLKPHNVGTLDAPDGRGEATNAACGDVAVMTVQLVDGAVIAARFVSESCAGGIACCSAATHWVTGKSLDDALSLDEDALANLLGGLPDAKMGCASMAVAALRAALTDAAG